MHNLDANHGQSGATAAPCELLPCPFCGKSDHQVGYVGQPAVAFFIKCGGCGAKGPELPSPSGAGGAFNPEAIAAWNRRAAMTAANGQAVPEGWKLVPLEANDDMVTAACEAANLFRVDAVRAIEAAIATAPQGEKK